MGLLSASYYSKYEQIRMGCGVKLVTSYMIIKWHFDYRAFTMFYVTDYWAAKHRED